MSDRRTQLVACTKDPACELAGGLCDDVRECGYACPPPQPDYAGAIAAIKELHYPNPPLGSPVGDVGFCHDDGFCWPCSTIQALGRYGCGDD